MSYVVVSRGALVVAAAITLGAGAGGCAPQDSHSAGQAQPAPVASDLPYKELVFVGRIDGLGPPPRSRSGGAVARQVVRYRVEKVLAGKIDASTVEVHRVVIQNSPTGARSKNALSQTVFAEGRKVIESARREKQEDREILVNDNELVTPFEWSEQLEAEVVKHLAE